MSQEKKLVIMAGGTGGHIFSGLAIAHYLMNYGWQVSWLGTIDHIEADLVPKYGIEKINFIHIFGIRDGNIKTLLRAPIYIFRAWCQARAIMQKIKPDIVLGMGGYVSGPGGLAAWSLGIPIILHEQNSVAGLTNKWLSKFASKVIQAFPGAFPKAKVVGNPIRVDILTIPQPEIRLVGRKGPIRILVIGGSQGARIFNKIMPQIAVKLGKTVIVWHQTGKYDRHFVEQNCIDFKLSQYKVTDFINNISIAYAWADIVICRAGALTVSEIAVVGLPALFVPFQHRDQHQYWNALLLEKIGAAKIFKQSQFTVDNISTILISWNRTILLEMAKRARSRAFPNSTEQIVKEIISMVGK